MNKAAGILLPIASLPSKYEIGTLGAEAYRFVDFLADAKQSYWQLLPLGPLSFGDSPYSSVSIYAGNPYLIDLDMLVDDGLLDASDVEPFSKDANPDRVDYARLYQNRFPILKQAAVALIARGSQDFESFKSANSYWLDDFSLYFALKRHYDMKPWYEWPDSDIRLHAAAACHGYVRKFSDAIEIERCIQYFFHKQWFALKAYANERNITIIGDIPIYVSYDSADVWSDSSYFQLNDVNVPTFISGVPPDAFSDKGQLWGNPLYDWDYMKRFEYDWWVRRISYAFRLYDVVRIDHFRGLESFWAVRYGSKDATVGEWIKGPGRDLIDCFNEKFSDREFIAEDLGFLTDGVRDLLKYAGYPGMKILEFAFDSRESGDYLPENYDYNSICYTGTHDNVPLAGWVDDASADDVNFAYEYFGVNTKDELCDAIIRAGMDSASKLFIVQMQDYLGLGAEARINIPGTLENNWVWRLSPDYDADNLAARIADLTVSADRA